MNYVEKIVKNNKLNIYFSNTSLKAYKFKSNNIKYILNSHNAFGAVFQNDYHYFVILMSDHNLDYKIKKLRVYPKIDLSTNENLYTNYKFIEFVGNKDNLNKSLINDLCIYEYLLKTHNFNEIDENYIQNYKLIRPELYIKNNLDSLITGIFLIIGFLIIAFISGSTENIVTS
jgi:hypothetical protein